jgi:predicted short-subunit dehydrogenase-like oxidoreductase (DUF2520 family)
MRELERKPPTATPAPTRCAIVGAGRLGCALGEAMSAAGFDVIGPLGRDPDVGSTDLVLLCVPDAEIRRAARTVPVRPGRLVGHCSGATGLDALEPHEAFSVHPLMAVTPAGARFDGTGCAIDGSTDRATTVARELAGRLGMRPVRIAPHDRAAYHAAASIASNFLVTLEAAAEQLMETAGGDRELLVPLVRATVENWARLGSHGALTGPIARGDELTVARQRQAVAERTPELLPLFDAMARATRELAAPPPPLVAA